MKFRLIKIGAAVLTGAAVISLSAAASVQAASIQASGVRAGVSAIVADCLRGNTDTMSAEKTAVQTETAESKKKQEKKSSSEKKQKEDKTICGYTNLGIANVDNYLNIRAEAGESGKIVGKLPSDAGCEILDAQDGWYHIRSGKVSGYVKADYIITGEKAEQMAEKLKKLIAVVNTLTVYIREEPNTDCTILTIVTADEELEVVKEGKEWIEIKLDDENGYVNAKYVDVSEQLKKASPYTETEKSEGVSDSRYSLAQTALGYVGGRYVWGGTSLANGVDCSGFTMQIMAKYGIYLPHSAAAQSAFGRSVSTSELQPGDLIFYGSGGSINHVAIYIGNGQIVHASNSRDGIKVSNAFYRTPVCCRRMF